MVENVDEKIGAMSEKIQHISINKMPSKNLRVHEMPTGPPKVDNCPRTNSSVAVIVVTVNMTHYSAYITQVINCPIMMNQMKDKRLIS